MAFQDPYGFCCLCILSFGAKDCGEFEVRSTELILEDTTCPSDYSNFNIYPGSLDLNLKPTKENLTQLSFVC